MTTLRAVASAVLTLAVVLPPSLCGQMTDVKPMADGAHPSFEVATIKPSKPDDQNSGFMTIKKDLFIENETMDVLIGFAYGVQVKQIVDAPAWFGSEHFDIKGFADVEGEPSVPQYREMVRKLLTDRFQLQFQKQEREMSCFVLTVAKGGPKMRISKSAPDAGQDQSRTGDSGGQTSWRFTNNSMPEFAQFLQIAVLDRPVVDQTGLKGKYDFKVTWTSNLEAVGTDANAAPGFFAAIQEQDGLKVTPSKAEVDVLAITHVEQPSAN